MKAKPWWRSRTVWFNVATLAVTIAGVVADPALALDSRIVAGAAGVMTVGNVALRLLTNQPIAGTPADAPPHLRGTR